MIFWENGKRIKIMLITPKSVIEIVLARKTKNARFLLYETAVQKWLFVFSVGSLVIGFVTALTAYIWRNQYSVLVALIAVCISFVLAVCYQVASVLPELAKFRNIEREISTPLSSEFNNDVDLINELSRIGAHHHLSYAKANYVLMAKQLRERISVLVGAIEKVGVIPLAITAYLSYVKAIKEGGLVVFGGIEWVFVALLALYLFALRMVATAQWMERVAEIYEHALTLRFKG